ncbi:MAG TPA: polysaccharide deacetylase family protein [Terriglobales bacterium]|nr:polysaccharide deacetylase family protein [Terriglobales bacterium]
MSAKSWIKQSLVNSGALKLAARLRPQGAAVLMYHSVLDDPDQQWLVLGGIGHSTRVFRQQMEAVAGRYHCISLDDLLSYLRGAKELPPRAVVVTFDDGYADNLEVAVPILNELGVPATFYITVDCIESSRVPWPSRLRFSFFVTSESFWQQEGGKLWRLHDKESRNQAYLHACDDCAKQAGEAQRKFVDRIERELNAAVPNSIETRMMTWDQVRALRHKGHIVGSHTMTHPNMAYVSLDDARNELAQSKQKLDAELGNPVVHFSYPCPALWPHWNSQTLALSKEVGYETAVTTEGGMVRRQDDPLCLHRMRPSKNVNDLLWNLDCTFLGRSM